MVVRASKTQTPAERELLTQGVVYRAFNSDGRLLYVGKSLRPLKRIHSHEATSIWFRQVAKITLEHFHSREEAARGEMRAIVAENPLWNIQHAADWTEEELAELTACGWLRAYEVKVLTGLDVVDCKGHAKAGFADADDFVDGRPLWRLATVERFVAEAKERLAPPDNVN